MLVGIASRPATLGRSSGGAALRTRTRPAHFVAMTGAIVGMCNPLLDISAYVGTDLLKKYNLEPNNAILAEEKHIPLYAEVEDKFPVEFTAGGAGQNSIRVAQWLLQKEGETSFFGAIGKDAFGDKMIEGAQSGGVNVQYLVNPEVATGTCAVLITEKGKCRSLVANLSAANTYTVDHLKETAQWDKVEQAKIFYITGFFYTVSPESIMAIGQHAADNNKTLCMNLSAPFLIEVPMFFEQFKEAMKFVDVYFGNETEARALSTVMEWGTEDVSEIAVRLAQTPGKLSSRPRTVIFTQGAEPTVVAVGDGAAKLYPVIPCSGEELVDSNGAGDAFVGGILAGMAQEFAIDECIPMANYAANVVIQRSGCTLPAAPSFSS